MQILYTGHIAVTVIGVAAAELLFVKLDAVKADRIDIVIIGQRNSNGAVGFFRDHRCGAVLPMDITVRIRVKLRQEFSGTAIRIVKGAKDGKLAAGWLVNQSSSRRCFGAYCFLLQDREPSPVFYLYLNAARAVSLLEVLRKLCRNMC